MSDVNLRIAGRSYAVACAEGEEAHVIGLGSVIDAKVAEMGSSPAQSEVRTMLFAALLLADEVSELRKTGSSVAKAGTRRDVVLDAIANRLENIVAQLERKADSA